MKRKSIVVTALIVLWIGYVSLSTVQYYGKIQELSRQDVNRRVTNIGYHLYAASPLLAEGKHNALVQNLIEARSTREFDFYILRLNDELIAHLYPGHSEEYVRRVRYPLGFFKTPEEDVYGKTIKVGDYELSMGLFVNQNEFVVYVLSELKWDLIQDLLLVTIFLGLLIYGLLRDILSLSRVLSSKDRSRVGLVKVHSKEAETLLAVTSQFERVNEGLKLKNQVYSETLSPAIRYELNQETPVPHAFPAVVVRIDVNGYTQMFLEKKDQFVARTLNRYFQLAAEVIHRFGGHVYQYVGDEIVFHFKETEHEDAFKRAVHCVRSLFQVAKQIDEGLKPEGVPFIVKASIARGKLRFIRLDSSYAFAGLPLIESVRMLGKIEERENDILAVYSDDYSEIKDLAAPFKTVKVAFKGFAQQSEIIEIKDFAPVSEALEAKDIAGLEYYKSDADIVAILSDLKTRFSEFKKEEFLHIYKVLKSANVEKVGGALTAAFAELFTDIDAWAAVDAENETRTLALASFTSLAGTLLRSGALPESMRLIMERNLQHKDPRVRGNTVLALDELSPETYSFKEMFALPFNRAAADALIAEGRRDYTPEVHGFLKDFLASKDPFFVASGIYVLAYLYDFHRQRDSVYFKANSWLQEIPGLINQHSRAKDNMVRRRAQISMAKIQDAEAA
jgi:adenylate cyclase